MSYNNPPPGDYSGGGYPPPGDYSGGGYPPPGDYSTGGYPPPGDQGGYPPPPQDPGYPASGGGYGPPPPPPKKGGLGTGAIIGIVAGGLALLCVCVVGVFVLIGVFASGGTTVNYAAKAVGGSLTSVTYTEGSDSSNYDSASGTTWTKTVTTTKTYVSLSVRATTDYSSSYSTGAVACAITANGKEVDSSSGTSSAYCSGSID